MGTYIFERLETRGNESISSIFAELTITQSIRRSEFILYEQRHHNITLLCSQTATQRKRRIINNLGMIIRFKMIGISKKARREREQEYRSFKETENGRERTHIEKR